MELREQGRSPMQVGNEKSFWASAPHFGTAIPLYIGSRIDDIAVLKLAGKPN